MNEYAEKIKKLLKLAESPVEAEAKAALLKARELMAKYKMTEADIVDKPSMKVVRVDTGISCSRNRNPWAKYLASVIAENYCCSSVSVRKGSSVIDNIYLVGFEDDVELCETIFKYAYDSAISANKQIKKEYKPYGQKAWKRACDGYGYGFMYGVEKALQEQTEQNEEGWGLVMQKPQEVDDYLDDCGCTERNFESKYVDSLHGSMMNKGYNDGKEFDPSKKLATV